MLACPACAARAQKHWPWWCQTQLCGALVAAAVACVCMPCSTPALPCLPHDGVCSCWWLVLHSGHSSFGQDHQPSLAHLAAGLAQNSSLLVLDLSRSGVLSQGAALLAAALGPLRVPWLPAPCMADRGKQGRVEVFNVTLQSLDLSHNAVRLRLETGCAGRIRIHT